MKRTFAALLLGLTIACGGHTPPQPPPPTPRAALAVVAVEATNQNIPVVGALVSVHTGETCVTNNDGYCLFNDLIVGERGITVTHSAYNDAFVEAKPFLDNTTVFAPMQRLKPPMGPLVVSGKYFFENGVRWNWRGASGFSLAFDIQTGQQGKVERFLDWAVSERVTVVRVFTTAVNLFNLDPVSGRLGAVTVLELAKERGLRVELVGLADTKLRAFDHAEHIYALGQICHTYVNCLLEIANEPNHDTQLDIVAEVPYLRGLKALVPESVVLTLGASHGPDDENPIYWINSDYAVVHGDRKGGWDSVRHTREMQWLRDSGNSGTGKPVVNDEPDRRLTVAQHSGMGLLSRLFSIGDTVHLLPLMYGTVPSGDDMAAFVARRDGWDAFPADWEGRYYNPSTIGGGPIRSFDPAQIVRLYGALNGNAGYIVGLGVSSENSIEWQWQHDRLVANGDARLWFTRQ